MKLLSIITLLSIGFSQGALAAQTVAPPELQKQLIGVFPKSAKCGDSVRPRVLSSEKSKDAVVDGGKLVSGEIREAWEATTCDSHVQVRYLFRFGLGKDSELSIVGFERMK